MKDILISLLPIRSQRQSIAAIITSFRKTSAGDYKQIIKFKGAKSCLILEKKFGNDPLKCFWQLQKVKEESHSLFSNIKLILCVKCSESKFMFSEMILSVAKDTFPPMLVFEICVLWSEFQFS